MSKDNSRARTAEVHETHHASPLPSRRGLLAAGTALAGGAMAELLATEAVAAGTSVTQRILRFKPGASFGQTR